MTLVDEIMWGSDHCQEQHMEEIEHGKWKGTILCYVKTSSCLLVCL